MRYYHPFPEAIPRLKAGCSRVTHPSATKNQKQALNSPFDLHVLGVPPAFVLSQDQTLYKFVSLQRFFRFSVIISSLRITRNYCFTLCYSLFADFTLIILLLSSLSSSEKRNLRVPVLFVSIVQFSRCKRLFSFSSEVQQSFSLPLQLLYYTTFFEVCQEVFQNFFQSFFFASSH